MATSKLSDARLAHVLQVVKFADGDRLRQLAPTLEETVRRLGIRRRRAAKLPDVPASCALDVGSLVDWFNGIKPGDEAVEQVKAIDEAFRARV